MPKSIANCCLLALALISIVHGADWLMWKFDAGRTANSPAALPMALLH